MKNLKALLAVPAAFGAVLAVSGNAVAAESLVEENLVESVAVESVAVEAADTVEAADVMVAEPIQLAQVTSVSELSDVRASDWAFTALQRLVEEYGCLEGYPDRTFRGNRAMTRYEFAAGLNACLDVVIQLIGGGDLTDVRRLQEEFAAELATIRGRTDLLEADVAELEANQFSTTTKLRGQVDAHLVVPFGEADGEVPLLDDDGNQATDPDGTPLTTRDTLEEADATFEYRARLNFDTSFTGEDRLRLRLQASDSASSLVNAGGLASQSGRRNGFEDNIGLDDVYYSFPIGNRISGIIAANSIVTDDFVTSTIVPYDGPAVADVSGPVFYDQFAGGNFGAGVNFAFTDNLVLDLGYSSEASNVNTDDGGIFEEYSYIAQLNFLTDGLFNAAVTYIDGESDELDTPDYTIAGLLNLDFGRVEVGGHYAYSPSDDGDQDSYGLGVTVPDLFGAGNQLGLYGTILPDDEDEPLVVEAYYQLGLNEYFSITPAVIYADNDSGDDSENIYGALRATFNF
ncbi:iron uptake porin [cf. Phormidesmis sp. LEGE 11477]|uniref:iron uptake porin n=1 Tax=cf. Phormidesmis sp. LEGE 11477 TaxID=1828680 RepID=UPI00187F7C15|nr:iron uptake porin [cf. Phormidesmis sp. LEGE 11477]MBE9061550.1 carbohydrate porin [cf. Phormidesmis sp. LEGE 11477]